MSQLTNHSPTYIIAEISANHNGSLASALELINIAKNCGADAVKIQTYTADTLTLNCDNEHFRISGGTLWDGKTLHELYAEAYTPWEWHEEIFAYAKSLGLDCFSTPFDESSVDFLEQFSPPYYKIASFELVHDPLLVKIAKTGRPVIMSTGMATFDEIQHAVNLLRSHGCESLALLKCTSSYPAPVEEANLARIPDMMRSFECAVGLSDHTLGIVAPIVAISLGATIIEKHLCISRDEPGPDSAFSLEPKEFEDMCTAIRVAEKSIGEITYERTSRETAGLTFRRSIFFSKSLNKGHVVTEADVRIVRPAMGLSPKHWDSIIGKPLGRYVEFGTPVSWDCFE
jgi:pseudaminic acid synthase